MTAAGTKLPGRLLAICGAALLLGACESMAVTGVGVGAMQTLNGRAGRHSSAALAERRSRSRICAWRSHGLRPECRSAGWHIGSATCLDSRLAGGSLRWNELARRI